MVYQSVDFQVKNMVLMCEKHFLVKMHAGQQKNASKSRILVNRFLLRESYFRDRNTPDCKNLDFSRISRGRSVSYQKVPEFLRSVLVDGKDFTYPRSLMVVAQAAYSHAKAHSSVGRAESFEVKLNLPVKDDRFDLHLSSSDAVAGMIHHTELGGRSWS